MLDMSKAALPPLQPPDARRSPPQMSADANLDRMLHAWQSRFTGGRSPSTVGLAFLDWAAHAANAPFQTAALGRTALAQWPRLAQRGDGRRKGDRVRSRTIIASPIRHGSRRPYDLLTQAVLLGEEWWDSVVRSPGRSRSAQSSASSPSRCGNGSI